MTAAIDTVRQQTKIQLKKADIKHSRHKASSHSLAQPVIGALEIARQKPGQENLPTVDELIPKSVPSSLSTERTLISRILPLLSVIGIPIVIHKGLIKERAIVKSQRKQSEGLSAKSGQSDSVTLQFHYSKHLTNMGAIRSAKKNLHKLWNKTVDNPNWQPDKKIYIPCMDHKSHYVSNAIVHPKDWGLLGLPLVEGSLEQMRNNGLIKTKFSTKHRQT